MSAEAAYEEVDVVLEEGFLLAEGAVGEGVGEETAVATVVGVVGAEDGVDAVFGGGHPLVFLENTFIDIGVLDKHKGFLGKFGRPW